MKRNNKGQFQYIPFKTSKFTGLILLTSIMLLGYTLWDVYTPTELYNPLVKREFIINHVIASEPVLQPPETIQDKIRATFYEEPDKAVRIAFCESSFNPKAKNPKGTASGVMQITHPTWVSNKCTGDVFNADDNLKCARIIWERRGWQPWECK